MALTAMVVFALAVSADGFGVGVAYGVRNIKIPFLSLAVICLASMLVVSVSMGLGRGIAFYLTPRAASLVGAIILTTMGLWLVGQALQGNPQEDEADTTIFSLRIRPLGIMIQILREPARADFDASGEISTREAFFLGLALAMDAMAAGMGIAMAGYNILATALLVGTAKFFLVNAGLKLGKFAANGFLKKVSGVISGIILLSLGIYEMF